MSHPFRERVAASLRRTWGGFGSSAGLGADALYTQAGGGVPLAIRVMPVTADVVIDDVFSGRTRQTGRTFHVMTVDVADRPETGAIIELLDDVGLTTETFTVTEPALSEDSRRLVWRCAVAPSETLQPRLDFRDPRNSMYIGQVV